MHRFLTIRMVRLSIASLSARPSRAAPTGAFAAICDTGPVSPRWLNASPVQDKVVLTNV